MKFGYFLFFIIVCANGQNSPCQNIFQYNFKESEWYGSLQIPSNGKSQMELKVILTVPGIQSKNKPGQIVLENSLESVIQTIQELGIFRFKVIFPNPSEYPFLKSILLNGQEICHNVKVPTRGSISTITLQYRLDASRDINDDVLSEVPTQPKPVHAQNIPEYLEQIAPENQSVKEQSVYESEPKKVITTSTTTNTSSVITTVNKITNTTVTTISRS